MRTGRFAMLAAAGFLLAACGHGNGGGGTKPGSTDWGIPFVPASGARSMLVCLRNLGSSGAAATLQGYKPSGALYSGPVAVTLDGNDEHALSISTVLGGDVPAGGFVLVHTAGRNVEVAFNVAEPGKIAEESSRAWPLGDLAAPPATTAASVTITTETDLVQVSNATAGAIVLAVTAYDEPAGNAFLPPTVSTPAPIALAAWETKTLTPDAISGIVNFVGALSFTSAAPFFAAVEEDLSFDGTPPVTHASRQLYAALSFGLDTPTPVGYTDFALVVRNDADAARTVTIDEIHLENGADLISAPRTISLAARESRVVTTLDVPFDDLFGDATLEVALERVWMRLSVPADVDVAFRQYDPVALNHNMTVRPHPLGHVFETLEVFPQPTLPANIRTFLTLINPLDVEITIAVEALVPQPDGFDAGPTPVGTVIVPPRGRFEFSPDGTAYADRDLVAADLVGFRFHSVSPFSMFGRRESRNPVPFPLMVTISPTIIRDLDDAE